MSNFDRDDKQVMVHGFRQVAEVLAEFRKALLDAGIPRFLAGALTLRQFEVLTRRDSFASIIHIGEVDDDDQ